MRRIAIILVPLFVAACTTSSATVAPSVKPSASSNSTVAPSTGPSGTPPATIAPTDSPGPALTLAPSPSAPPPDQSLPPVFGAATLTTSGAPVANSDIGGCGSLWNGSAIYGSDDCGPHMFKLDAEPVVVAPGGIMTFAALAGYEFSIDRIAASPDAVGMHSWAISIASVSDLANLPDGQQEGITTEHGGRVLGHGDRAVISAWVKAPLARGEYLVQLDASVNDGPWTFTWPRFFWRVSVQ